MSKISVRFLINKEQKRVVCAEAGSDFVDVLFSFLTLPLGSIVRLLGKQSGFGSLDSLYEGVEQLDDKHLQTEACKEMLLNPRSATSIICEDLKIKNIHVADPRTLYICNESDCLNQSTCYYTYVKNDRCSRCGKLITNSWCWRKETSDDRGIFVNETIKFIITDNLHVIPTSLMKGFSLLGKLGVNDARILEERLIDFDTEEVLNLLRRSLVSRNPLTEICFTDGTTQTSVKRFFEIKEEMSDNEAESEITIKLFLNKKSNDVLYADVGEDFANQLLSFLTFPLGSVLKLLSDNVSILGGCISNLYTSAKSMSSECFKSENSRNMLLSPKLATFHGIEKQLLKLEEITSKKLSVLGFCPKCYRQNVYNYHYTPSSCKYEVEQSEVIEHNPKSGKVRTDGGGAFVVDSIRFLVADNLYISPLSFISAVNNYKTNFHISDLVVKTVYIDKATVLSLLGTMLISNTVLTDVFFPKPRPIKRSDVSSSSSWPERFAQQN